MLDVQGETNFYDIGAAMSTSDGSGQLGLVINSGMAIRQDYLHLASATITSGLRFHKAAGLKASLPSGNSPAASASVPFDITGL